MSIEFKFAKSKTIHEANIEGRLYTGRKICQNGQNRLCVSTAISSEWITSKVFGKGGFGF